MKGNRCWFHCFVLLILTSATFRRGTCHPQAEINRGSFVQTRGTNLVVDGKPFYVNGFNAYWMMLFAADPSTRNKVTETFREASKYGMNVARAWAFNDGTDYLPLQISPGSYNEEVFKGLDFVVAEAKKFGIRLILVLVNNYAVFGGKPQYVQWANEKGQKLGNEDEFFTNSLVKEFYKNNVKTMLTRKNTITGVEYKDDPTIFAWELMNEARCPTDPSGDSLQNWIKQMGAHVKSIDNHHLLGIGLEGFYGESMPEKKQYNPNNNPMGTDFISNNQITEIDFATIHIYPEHWLPPPMNSSEAGQLAFDDKWIKSHILDSDSVVKKPLLIEEFGWNSRLPGYSIEKRNNYFRRIYNAIYNSASRRGSCAGGLFWQLLTLGMEKDADGYEVVLQQSPSTASIIAEQSRKMSSIT